MFDRWRRRRRKRPRIAVDLRAEVVPLHRDVPPGETGQAMQPPGGGRPPQHGGSEVELPADRAKS